MLCENFTKREVCNNLKPIVAERLRTQNAIGMQKILKSQPLLPAY